jgi:ABC-type lipoprotein release transport system permease subunit
MTSRIVTGHVRPSVVTSIRYVSKIWLASVATLAAAVSASASSLVPAMRASSIHSLQVPSAAR